MDRKRITIIGHGNVGTHLCRAFREAGIEVLWRHSGDELEGGSCAYIVAVTDTQTAAVCRRAMDVAGEGIVVHTAGSVGIEVFGGRTGCGVLYPMQTFSKEREVDISRVPIFIEATDAATLQRIERLAHLLSPHVTPLTSAQRARLHVAAVFACNFVNHCLTLADGELQRIGLDYRVMLPLLDETVAKLYAMPPQAAQTGPAARGDRKVTERHEEMIEDEHARSVYHAMTESIGVRF